MLTIAQVDLFQAQLQTKMLEVAIEQAKAELNDDMACAKAHQCTYRFLSIYLAVFTNPLFNYTMAQTEAMILWISGVTSLNEVVPVSFTDYTVINTSTNHTHSISQVIGLQTALDDLQWQIDNIEDSQITEINGGHAPDDGTGITITIRNDNTVNWEKKDPILAIGEMGFAIDNSVVVGIKIGLGKSWKLTPYHISPFVPIVTDSGRNLDYPNSPYNASHNFQTETEAWNYVLNPYSAPYIYFPYGNVIAYLEVGDTFNNNNTNTYTYQFNIYNTPSILLEEDITDGNLKKMYYTTPDTVETILEDKGKKHLLTNQSQSPVLQSHSYPISITSGATGDIPVFTAYVRGMKDSDKASSIDVKSVSVNFRRRSVAFLWNADDAPNLLKSNVYTDVALTSIVESIRAIRPGTAYPIMAGGSGSKVFTPGEWGPTVPFDSKLFKLGDPGSGGTSGQFNIVVAVPVEVGQPIVYSSNDPKDAMKFLSPDGIANGRKFGYSHGTLTSSPIDYMLYIVQNVIIGSMPVKII